jgi:hypothetical protein
MRVEWLLGSLGTCAQELQREEMRQQGEKRNERASGNVEKKKAGQRKGWVGTVQKKAS